MTQVLRPQAISPLDSTQIGSGTAMASGEGLRALGNTVRQVGSASQSASNQFALGQQLGDAVSQYSKLIFRDKGPGQAGVVSNALADGTLSFHKAQQERLNQVTDADGNPTYDKLVDDIGDIGHKISQDLASKINDPEARRTFQARFKSYITDQQIKGVKVARKQEIDFGRTSVDRVLGALAAQGASADYHSVGTYTNQQVAVLNDARNSGLISPSEHASMKEDIVSRTREASFENTIRSDRAEATRLLRHSASELGLSEEQHKRMTAANHVAGVSDQIQAAKGVALNNITQESKKAALGQDLNKKIEANALREDELMFQEKNLEPKMYSQLRGNMVKKAKEFAKEQEDMQEVSNINATNGDLSKTTPAKVDAHYEYQVQTLAIENEAPVTLQQKAELATQYNGPVTAYATELNTTIQHGNPTEAAAAAISYSFVRDRDARALEGNTFTSDSGQIAESALLLNSSGMPLEQAVTVVRENIKNSTRERREELRGVFKKLKAFNIDNLNSTAASAVGATSFIFFKQGLDQNAQATFKKLAENNFLFNGDETLAKKVAGNLMRQNYGNSEVNGEKTFMLAPPEKIYQMPSGAIREQLLENVSTIISEQGIASEDVMLSSDRLTRGSMVNGRDGPVENITYAVTYLDKSGGVLPMLDGNGNLKRWKPDVDKFSKELSDTAREARDKKVEDARKAAVERKAKREDKEASLQTPGQKILKSKRRVAKIRADDLKASREAASIAEGIQRVSSGTTELVNPFEGGG